MIADSMDKIYKTICSDLQNAKEVRGTKELNNYSFTLTNIDNNVINIRDISKSYICGELLWYALGRKDVAFINKFAGLWGRISDDGETSYSAYGDIVFNRHGFNQVEKIIQLLCDDPESRRAVINFNVPNENVIKTKDEICTIALQFLIRDGKLNCTGIMRSNDVWYGLPYDVIFFTELTKYIARRVNVEVGTYTHTVISLHAYERNYDDIKRTITTYNNKRIKVDFEKLMTYKFILEHLVENCENPKNDLVEACEKFNILTEELK
jgi:thymidylate synthase